MFTVLIANGALGTSHYVGTFASEADAQAYIEREAPRTRKFVTFEIWTGTPRKPGKPVGARSKGLAGFARWTK